MIRDLKDPRAATVIERQANFWRNEDQLGKGFLWGRPLFQVRRVWSLTDTSRPHYLEPPPLLDAARFREQVERSYDRDGLLDDDLMRIIHTGVNSEVLVGCPVVVRAGSHWAEPCFVDWHQLDGYRVQETIWYQRLMENTRRSLEAVDSQQYPFCNTSFRGPVDMAAAMMSAGRLCTAVIDQPRALKDLLARITDIILETALAHATLLPLYRGGQFYTRGTWTPGRVLGFSVDAACLFSPACYEEFFLPCDQRLCAAFEAPRIHLHTASRQHFPAWTEIPNLGMQCVIDQAWLPEGHNRPIGPQLTELLPAFKAIRAHKALMLYGYWDEDLIDAVMRALPPGGCAITGMVEDPFLIRRRYLQPAPKTRADQ